MKNEQPAWPTSDWRSVPLDRLIPYARNSRTHSDAQVDEIAASIREWGWTMPILVDEDNMILAGHGRYAAAQRLGIEEVPVVVAHGWSEAKKRAYVIADNRLAENAGWDFELLSLELADLQEDGFDLSLVGLSDLEVLKLTSGAQGGNGAMSVGTANADGDTEVDVSEFAFTHACPRCGFEYNEKGAKGGDADGE